MTTLLYPRKNGTGDPVNGKLVPDYLVQKFLKQGFKETPDITNEKASEHFFNKKLAEAQNELKSEAQKIADERAEFEREKAQFLAQKNGGKIDGRTKEAKQV